MSQSCRIFFLHRHNIRDAEHLGLDDVDLPRLLAGAVNPDLVPKGVAAGGVVLLESGQLLSQEATHKWPSVSPRRRHDASTLGEMEIRKMVTSSTVNPRPGST